MKAYTIQSPFGVDSLTVKELPTPQPLANEVVLKMKAVSINFRDTFVIDGLFPMPLPNDFSPLSDGVGEVVAVGRDVQRVVIGDRVAIHPLPKWIEDQPSEEVLLATLGGPLPGVLREYVTAEETSLVKIPLYLSDIEAATLPIAAVTAWEIIHNASKIKKGQTILIQGTGGVSIFALQFAKALGVRVIITSSSNQKLAEAIKLGADATINYKDDTEWHVRAKELTDGKGVDSILDVAGGDLNEAIAAVKPGGNISIVGMLEGGTVNLDIIPLFRYNIQLNGITLAPRTTFEDMLDFMEQHTLHPIIGKVFTFPEAKKAIAAAKNSLSIGKIVIKIS